jgi:hypothetical protein
MRRLFSIAAFFVVVAVVSAPAQRGGMHSSGSHSGFSGRSGSVGHGSGGAHIGGTRFSGGHISSGFGSRLGPGSGLFSRGDHSRGGRFHDHEFRRRCLGCFGYGYPFYSYYDPYWWNDSYSSYNADYERDRQEANEMNAENLEEQRMREDQDAYAKPRSGRTSVAANVARPREEANEAPTTALVFLDRHVEEVKNYAIAGGTLWVLNDHQAGKKIPLAQLDLAATSKMNDDRGVDFQVPR